MVIDSSVLAAIMFDEPERAGFNAVIAQVTSRLVSAPAFLEAAMVIESRKGGEGRAQLDRYIQRAKIMIVPFDVEQAEIARTGWRAYGKGRHPACLNLGDCFSYALAKATGEPLLFKGDDFSLTDIPAALF